MIRSDNAKATMRMQRIALRMHAITVRLHSNPLRMIRSDNATATDYTRNVDDFSHDATRSMKTATELIRADLSE